MGGCIGWSTSWFGRSPVVRTVRRVEGALVAIADAGARGALVTTTVFCLAA